MGKNGSDHTQRHGVRREEGNRAKGKAIGWGAAKTWDRVAWASITVNIQYLYDKIRMRREEVEWLEGAGGNFVVW